MNRTKIVCTIGPAVNSLESVKSLLKAGMNVARLNFSHGTHKEHQETVTLLKTARRELNCPLAIMLDTKGPEIRVGTLKDKIELQTGDRLILVDQESYNENSEGTLAIDPISIFEDIEEGMEILFDDGLVKTKATKVSASSVEIEALGPGVLTSRRGVNIPEAKLSLPALTEKDKEDIRFAVENDLDLIAASFIRSAPHVFQIKRFIEECGGKNLLVGAKIENQEGVDNFDAIVQAADAIMIARGDLGVEVPIESVPKLQKMMIRRCYLAGKPSITATQMLESMIHHPRPTRAEISDVANAIYDGTSAVMLSGETASGKYPLEAVRIMRQTIVQTEDDFDYEKFFTNHMNVDFLDVSSCIALATVKTAFSSHAKAIFVFTSSGRTARLISRLRPDMPILANTDDPKSYHQMALNWGIHPVLTNRSRTLEEGFKRVEEYALTTGYVDYGDLVLMTAGTPFGQTGTTNLMMLESIGQVLLRAKKGVGTKVVAPIEVFYEDEQERSLKGKIVVLQQFNEGIQELLEGSVGLILENPIHDTRSEELAKEYANSRKIPLLLRADGASVSLKSSDQLILDPEKAIVYRP